ncbi:MAG: endolytic transglycosylase MltG, partial [Trebonia sp.]
ASRPADRGGRGPGGPGGPGDRVPGDFGPDPRGMGADPRDWDDRDRRPRKKATRWIPRILVLTVVAVIVIGGLVGGLDIYHKYQARYHPADYAGPGTGDVTVQVMSGDTAFSLAPRLLQLGVIASTRAFTNAAETATSTTSTTSTGLEAGYYQLHEHMQASLAYAALTNPKNVVQTTVTIPEGKRAVDVIAIIAEKTKIPLKNFQQVLANPSQLGLPSYANGKVEGYLFPATYAIVPHETALQILQAMVQRFNVEAQGIDLVNAAKSVDLTPTQLIIEASLAQAEGGSVSDYPKIAEVIHNRLAIGMHLQFDSTVLYGLGKYAVSATIKQTQTPGPYNTYLNAGLPAGPISNPGDSAIQGILHAEHGNWLYFLTKPGGQSEFSSSPLKGQ